MDARLRAKLMTLLETPYEMASGAGHDAAIFAGMVRFVRYQTKATWPPLRAVLWNSIGLALALIVVAAFALNRLQKR